MHERLALTNMPHSVLLHAHLLSLQLPNAPPIFEPQIILYPIQLPNLTQLFFQLEARAALQHAQALNDFLDSEKQLADSLSIIHLNHGLPQ